MTDVVVIELQYDFDNPEAGRLAVEQALSNKGCARVVLDGEDALAFMPDCRDAEETVMCALDDAGIDAYVYQDNQRGEGK